MTQVARNVTMTEVGFLADSRYLIHDRDGKYCAEFDETISAAGVKPIKLPAQSPNLNSYAERWVRSVKDECLLKRILFGEASLRRALGSYSSTFTTSGITRARAIDCYYPPKSAGSEMVRFAATSVSVGS